MTDIDTLAATIRAGLDADEMWAIEGSRRDDNPVPPGGVHWHWVDSEDHPVTPDPARCEHLTDDHGCYEFSLRSVEEFETCSVGLLPQFAIHSGGEILAAAAGHIVRHDPHAVLRRVARDRRLLDLLLAEKHAVDDSGWCDCEQLVNGPCTCGRDARVAAYLAVLAEAYEETT